MKDLIEKQKEYIEFLSKEIENMFPIAYIHRYRCSEESMKKGEQLREEIKLLEEKYKNIEEEKL